MPPPPDSTSAGPVLGGATNWSEYDVPAIWSMIEDFDTGPQWRHVAGWKKAGQLTELHLKQMGRYRDWLAATWPPERNEASRVYLAEFDRLTASVQATYDAAVANQTTMSAVTHAINDARDQLRVIYDRWRASASAMADFDARVAASNSGAPAPMPGPPPLAPGWREELNDQARRVMDLASGEIARASLLIVTPPDYSSPVAKQDHGTDRSSRGTATRLAAPDIPAPATTGPAVRPASGGVPAGHDAGRVVLTGGVHGHPAPAVHGHPAPTLAKTSTDPERPLPRAGQEMAAVVAPLSPGPTRSRPVAAHGPRVSAGGVPAGPSANAPSPPAVAARQPSAAALPGPVMGGTSPPARSTHFVNPVGGVFAGVGGGGGAAASGAGTSNALPPSRPGKETTGSRGAAADYRTADGHLVTISRTSEPAGGGPRQVPNWNPDDPWTVDGGVPPVIEPGRRGGNHTAGPAIGLPQPIGLPLPQPIGLPQ